MVSKCCWRDNPGAEKSPEGDQGDNDRNGSTNNLLDYEESCDKKLEVSQDKRRSSTASSTTTGSGISDFFPRVQTSKLQKSQLSLSILRCSKIVMLKLTKRKICEIEMRLKFCMMQIDKLFRNFDNSTFLKNFFIT